MYELPPLADSAAPYFIEVSAPIPSRSRLAEGTQYVLSIGVYRRTKYGSKPRFLSVATKGRTVSTILLGGIIAHL